MPPTTSISAGLNLLRWDLGVFRAPVSRSFSAAQPEAAAAGIIAVSDGFALRVLYDPEQAEEFCTALRPVINHVLAI